MAGSQPSATRRTWKVGRGLGDLGRSTRDILQTGHPADRTAPPLHLLALSPLALAPSCPPPKDSSPAQTRSLPSGHRDTDWHSDRLRQPCAHTALASESHLERLE